MSDPNNANSQDDSLVKIDDEGDLILRTKDKSFQACSSALRRASPPMKAMLFGPWKEANQGKRPWVVELLDDSSEVLEIALPVMHGKTYCDNDLELIEPRLMVEILNFLDKYLIQDLNSWFYQWIKARNRAGWRIDHDAKFGSSYLENLQAAWDLGLGCAVSHYLALLLHEGKAEDLDRLEKEDFF
jgi:hypothetical protein